MLDYVDYFDVLSSIVTCIRALERLVGVHFRSSASDRFDRMYDFHAGRKCLLVRIVRISSCQLIANQERSGVEVQDLVEKEVVLLGEETGEGRKPKALREFSLHVFLTATIFSLYVWLLARLIV